MSINKRLSNRYLLLERVGIGGFSEVWKATDLETETTVALKLFLRQDKQSIALFEAEYARMQGFEHPHILKPQAFGVEDDLPYFVMEYCEKGTLLNRIGRLDEPQIAQVMAQIASALVYIHERQIVHKDIKPDNILIDAAGNYLLTDFGISKELEQRLTKSINVARLTEAQSRKNKDNKAAVAGIAPMAYRAPESFNFKAFRAEKETTAFDIWAFGATLYQVACKNLPFEEAGGFQQLIASASGNAHIGDLVMELPPQYSRKLDKILKACLEFETKNRLSATDLQRIADTYLKEDYWQFTERQTEIPTLEKPKRATQKIERIEAVNDPIPTLKEAKTKGKRPFRFPFAAIGYSVAATLAIGIYWAWKIGYPEYQLKNSHIATAAADDFLAQKNYEKADSLYTLALTMLPNDGAVLEKKQKAQFLQRTKKYERVAALSDGLAAFGEVVNGKMLYGYVDSSGRVNIYAQYDLVTPFTEGVAAVAKQEKAYIINKKNMPISDEKFSIPAIFNNGKARIVQNGKVRFVSLRNTQ